MRNIFRLIGLVVAFMAVVSCCSRNNRLTKPDRDIPIDPASVLYIMGSNILTNVTISGSGIIIDSNETESWALTAGHVCYPNVDDPFIMVPELWVLLGVSLNGESEFADVIAIDQTSDACVLRLPMGNLPVVELANAMPAIGQKVYLGAYPLGVYQVGHVPFFEGYYAGIINDKASYTIPVTNGSSGGGIINSRGQVVGIVSMAINGFENITLTTKLQDIQNLLTVAKQSPHRLTIVR